MIVGRTLFGHRPLLDILYYIEHELCHNWIWTIGLIPLLDIWWLINHSNGHHLIYIIMILKLSFNQSYYAKHIIYLFQPLSWFLNFGLYLFCRLKNAPKAIGLCSPMSSSGLNSPKQIRVKQSHPSSGRHMATHKKGPHQHAKPKLLWITISSMKHSSTNFSRSV